MAGPWDRLRELGATAWRKRREPPREPGRGVSSFHLWWQGLEGPLPLVEVGATVTVLQRPAVDRLYFWALQASFLSADAVHGAAHLGLQWNPRHPGNTAVNWGGYGDVNEVQSILRGTRSELPSTPDDPNTRDYPWQEGTPYRLRIFRGDGGWRGEVTDVAQGESIVVRDLHAGGDRLGGFVVWAEVFAACTDPTTVVQWSGFTASTAEGEVRSPASVRVTFPRGGDCPNTDVVMSASGLLQVTNVARTARDQGVLPVPARG